MCFDAFSAQVKIFAGCGGLLILSGSTLRSQGICRNKPKDYTTRRNYFRKTNVSTGSFFSLDDFTFRNAHKKAFWDLTNMTSGFATMCSRGRRKFLKISKTLSKHSGISWETFYDHTTLQKNYIET